METCRAGVKRQWRFLKPQQTQRGSVDKKRKHGDEVRSPSNEVVRSWNFLKNMRENSSCLPLWNSILISFLEFRKLRCRAFALAVLDCQFSKKQKKQKEINRGIERVNFGVPKSGLLFFPKMKAHRRSQFIAFVSWRSTWILSTDSGGRWRQKLANGSFTRKDFKRGLCCKPSSS